MVFKQLLKIELKKGKVKIANNPKPSHEVVIKLEITGNVQGMVVYSIGFYTVNKIADVLVPGLSEEQIMCEYKDIIGELANMITGNAINILSDKGLDISTPTVMDRPNFGTYSTGKYSVLVLNLYSPYGPLEISIAVK